MKCNFHLLRLLLPVLLLIQTSCGLNQKPRRLPTLADTCAGILTVKRGLDPDGALIADLVNCAIKRDADGHPVESGVFELVNKAGPEGIDHMLDFLRQESPFPGDPNIYPWLAMMPVVMERSTYDQNGLRLSDDLAERRLDQVQSFMAAMNPYRLVALVLGWHEKGVLDPFMDHAVALSDALPEGAMSAMARTLLTDETMRLHFGAVAGELLYNDRVYEALVRAFTLEKSAYLPAAARTACLKLWIGRPLMSQIHATLRPLLKSAAQPIYSSTMRGFRLRKRSQKARTPIGTW